MKSNSKFIIHISLEDYQELLPRGSLKFHFENYIMEMENISSIKFIIYPYEKSN